MRELIMLDETGHSEFSWTEDTDEVMIEFIQKKMKQGVRFFILEPRKILPDKMKPVNSVFDIGPNRKVSVSDSDMRKIVESGYPISTSVASDENLKTTGIAKTATEVVQNRTMAMRPVRGG